MGRDKVKLVRALGVPELPAEGSDTKQRFAALRGSSSSWGQGNILVYSVVKRNPNGNYQSTQ